MPLSSRCWDCRPPTGSASGRFSRSSKSKVQSQRLFPGLPALPFWQVPAFRTPHSALCTVPNMVVPPAFHIPCEINNVVSHSTEMRLTSKGPDQNRSKKHQKAPKSIKNVQNASKTRAFRLAHLNIFRGHPLWRYRQGRFCPSEAPKRAVLGAQFDVSGFAEMRLTSRPEGGNRDSGFGIRKRPNGTKVGSGSLFPAPESRLPVPAVPFLCRSDSRFPNPGSLFPAPESRLPVPAVLAVLFHRRPLLPVAQSPCEGSLRPWTISRRVSSVSSGFS
jgi:hypothetical protein